LGKKAEGSEKAAVVALSCVCCRHVCICAGVALPGGSCQSWLGIAEAMMAMRTRMRMGWAGLGDSGSCMAARNQFALLTHDWILLIQFAANRPKHVLCMPMPMPMPMPSSSSFTELPAFCLLVHVCR